MMQKQRAIVKSLLSETRCKILNKAIDVSYDRAQTHYLDIASCKNKSYCPVGGLINDEDVSFCFSYDVHDERILYCISLRNRCDWLETMAAASVYVSL